MGGATGRNQTPRDQEGWETPSGAEGRQGVGRRAGLKLSAAWAQGQGREGREENAGLSGLQSPQTNEMEKEVGLPSSQQDILWRPAPEDLPSPAGRPLTPHCSLALPLGCSSGASVIASAFRVVHSKSTGLMKTTRAFTSRP